MKKLLALLLIIAMAVFCFTACGEPTEENGGNENGNEGGSNGSDLFPDNSLPPIFVEPDQLS